MEETPVRYLCDDLRELEEYSFVFLIWNINNIRLKHITVYLHTQANKEWHQVMHTVN